MGLFDIFRKRRDGDAAKRLAKKFKLSADEIQPLVPDMGGCIASDMITVEGCKVGFMYREDPDNEADSGWVFLSGRESQRYMDNAANHGVYAVNTICNYDRSIIAHLDAPPGMAFLRDDATGEFVAEWRDRPGEPVDEAAIKAQRQRAREAGLNPDFPVMDGPCPLTETWSITLPGPFNRRMEDGDMCIWRPGLTIWVTPFNNDANEPKQQRMEALRGAISPQASDVSAAQRGELLVLAYRLAEDSEDSRQPAFYGLAVADDGHLQMAIYFDNEADLPVAQAIWDSVTATR